MLSEKLKGKQIKNRQGLKYSINQIWRSVDAAECKRLLRAVPLRLKDVIDSDGKRLLSRRTSSGQSR